MDTGADDLRSDMSESMSGRLFHVHRGGNGDDMDDLRGWARGAGATGATNLTSDTNTNTHCVMDMDHVTRMHSEHCKPTFTKLCALGIIFS